MAAGSPGRVQSLVLGDIGPDKNLADIRATRIFFNKLPASFRSEAEALAHWRKRKPGYPEERLRLLMRNMQERPDGGLAWRYSTEALIAAVTAARSREWWDLLPDVRCPVLLLHAEGSKELSGEVAGRMRRELRDVRYVRVPACGHNFHLENPEFAAAEIQKFIGEVAE
jgi:pimeloyl-ACP methyl ester carboxylesterase